MSDRFRAVATLVLVGASVAGLTVGGAAQQAGGRGQAPRTAQTPPPPINWPAPPLPDGTIALETAEERNVRIVVTKGLSHPWGMALLPDGMVYMSMGNSSEGENAPAQNPANCGGKSIRLRDDGTVPPDNPFVNRAGYKPESYTLGHRNQLGLAVHPVTGEVWAAEQGPNGGDEINILEPGRNYGWPVVSYGRSYGGPRVSDVPWQAVFEQPVTVWVPSIAVSGLTFYTGDKFPRWRNNLFVGGLRQGEVPRTGQLQRIVFNDKWEEIRREALLREFHQRIRDVREGPDGFLYVLTEENDAALLRFEPGIAPAK